MRQSKIRINAYLEPETHAFLYKYGLNKHLKNMTQVITYLVVEFKRYKYISDKLHEEHELRRLDQMKDAEVIK